MAQVLSLLGWKHAKDWLAQVALILCRIGGVGDRFYCSKMSRRNKFAQRKDRLVSLMVSILQIKVAPTSVGNMELVLDLIIITVLFLQFKFVVSVT